MNCTSAFEGCTSFNQPITIPSTASTCESMFLGCSNLTSIKCYCETPPKAGGAITDMLTTCILYVPKQSIQVYKDDANWGQFNFINNHTLFLLFVIFHVH